MKKVLHIPYYVITLAFLFAFYGVSLAQATFTWIGPTNGNWTTAANWNKTGTSTSTFPGQNAAQIDDVVIGAGSSPIILGGTFSGSVRDMTLNSSATLTLNSTIILTLTRNITINGTIVGNNTGTVRFSGGTTNITATSGVIGGLSQVSIAGNTTVTPGSVLTINSGLTINTGITFNNNNGSGTLTLAAVNNTGTFTNNGVVVFSGNLSGTGTYNLGIATTSVTYNGTTGQTALAVNYNNLTISGTGSKNFGTGAFSINNNLIVNAGATLQGNATPNNITLGGDLTVNGSITSVGTLSLNKNNGIISGTGSITATNFLVNNTSIVNFGANITLAGTTPLTLAANRTLQNDGTLQVGGNITLNIGSQLNNVNYLRFNGTTFITTGASFICGSASTVEYGGGNQNIIAPASSSYQNLVLSGAGTITKTLTANITVVGNFTNTGSTTRTLDLSSFTLTQAGASFTYSSPAITASGGTLTFGNGSNTTITGAAFSVPLLAISKNIPFNSVTLANGGITVINGINFSGNARLITNATNLLTLGASVLGIVGANADRFVVGPIRKILNNTISQTVTFNVGTSTYGYTPLVLNLPSGTSNVTVTPFQTTPPTGTLGTGLARISTSHYWRINSSAAITLTNPASFAWNTASMGVTDLSTLRVARLNAGVWEAQNVASTSGTSAAGQINANLLSASLSLGNNDFTLASTSAFFNPLQYVSVNYTSNTATGNWDNNASWTPTGIPTALDNVTILNGHTINIIANQDITNLTINTGGTLRFNTTSATTLTTAGNIVLNGTLTNNASGTANFTIFNNNSVNNLSGAGVISPPLGTLNININDDITVLSGSNLNFQPSNFTIAAGKIFKVSNATNDTQIAYSTPVIINGTYTNGGDSSSFFAISNFGQNVTATGIVNNHLEGRMFFNGLTTISTFNVVSGPNIVAYNAATNQDIIVPTSGSYYRLMLGGGGNKTLSADVSVLENFTANIAILRLTTGSITLNGNWTYNASNVDATSTGVVIFAGTSNTTISGTPNHNINRIRFAKTFGATLTLNNPIIVGLNANGLVEFAGTANMRLVTTATNLLTLQNNITTFNGGTTNAYINGLVRKVSTTLAANITLPIGNTNRYAPIILNLPSLANVTVQYFESTPATGTFAGGIVRRSEKEFWRINATSAITLAATNRLVIAWNSGSFSGINNLADLRVAHLNAGVWTGYTGSTTGTVGAGSVSAGVALSLVTGNNDITFASANTLTNPLGNALTYVTNKASGVWNNSSDWTPNGIPANGDNVIILTGHTMQIPASYSTATLSNVSIQSGATLSHDNNATLQFEGDYTNNGMHLGVAADTVQVRGVSTSLFGTGTLNNITFSINPITPPSFVLIENTATYTLFNGANFLLSSGAELKNNGTLFILHTSNNINASAGNFSQGFGAYLEVQGALVGTNYDFNSGIGNTVAYSREDGSPQTVISTNYQNLTIGKTGSTGTNVKNVSGSFNINGDLVIHNNHELAHSGASNIISLFGDYYLIGMQSVSSGSTNFTLKKIGGIIKADIAGARTINGNMNLIIDKPTTLTAGSSLTINTQFFNVSIASVFQVENTLATNLIINSPNITIAGDFINGNGGAATSDVAFSNGSATFNISTSGKLINGANTILNIATNITNAGIFDASATNNLVRFNRAGTQTVLGNVTYHHLHIQNTGGKTLNGDINVNGDLRIIGPGDFNGSSHVINIAGNWQNNLDIGSFVANTSTVIFTGSATQQINRNTAFYNLQVNKTGTSELQLAGTSTLTVTGVFSFGATADCRVVTNGNLFFINSGITSVANASTNRYVIGTMRKVFSILFTNFTYPIGSVATYAPMQIDVLTSGAEIEAEYLPTLPPNVMSFGTPLVRVSKAEYWRLRNVAGSSATAHTFTLAWNNGTTVSYIDNLPDLRLAVNMTGTWQENSATASGTVSTGTIGNSSSVSLPLFTNRFFTFGSVNIGNNPLSPPPINYTSVSSGNWNNASTWSPVGIPTATDNVTINNPHSVVLTANQVVNNLTINAGGTLNQQGFDLDILGNNFTNNGYHQGLTPSAECNILNAAMTLQGNASIDNVFYRISANCLSLATLDMLFGGSDLQITNNATFINEGHIKLAGTGADVSVSTGAIFRQGNAGFLDVTNGNLTGLGTYDFTSNAGNTVRYNGGVQTILPVDYYNLHLDGTGAKTHNHSSLKVNGNLHIDKNISFEHTNAVTLDLHGDYISNNGTHTANASPSFFNFNKNSGSVLSLGTGTAQITGQFNISIKNDTEIDDTAGGRFTFNNNGTWGVVIGKTLTNKTKLRVFSSGAKTISGALINEDSLTVAGSAPLTIAGAYVAESGSTLRLVSAITLNVGSTFDVGTHPNLVVYQIEGTKQVATPTANKYRDLHIKAYKNASHIAEINDALDIDNLTLLNVANTASLIVDAGKPLNIAGNYFSDITFPATSTLLLIMTSATPADRDITVQGNWESWNVTNNLNNLTILGDATFRQKDAIGTNLYLGGSMYIANFHDNTIDFDNVYLEGTQSTVIANDGGDVTFLGKLVANKTSNATITLGTQVEASTGFEFGATAACKVLADSYPLVLSAIVTSVPNAALNRYVVGTIVKKMGASITNFLFPLGNTNRYAPLSATLPSGSYEITANYIEAQPTFASINLPLIRYSKKEYWTLNPTVNVTIQDITLGWNDGFFSGITDLAQLAIAKLETPNWQSTAASYSAAGTIASGTIVATSSLVNLVANTDKIITFSSLSATSNPLGASFVVTNTNNSGTGSLAQAIIDANTSGGGIITFDIPTTDSNYNSGTDTWTISPTTSLSLPQIITPITIDGFSQLGASPNTAAIGSPIDANLKIVLNYANLDVTSNTGGLEINGVSASGSVIQGLVINGMDYDGSLVDSKAAIKIYGSSNNTIRGCFIGTNYLGTNSVIGTSGFVPRNGIYLSGDCSNNLIGGTNPADRNLISGGTNLFTAIFYHFAQGTNNRILGNYIGTQADGVSSFPNKGLRAIDFISSFSATLDVQVGGTSAGEPNIIAYQSGGGTAAISTSYFSSFPINILARRNIVFCNDWGLISNNLPPSFTPIIAPPVITAIDIAANTINGTSEPNAAIDIYLDTNITGCIGTSVPPQATQYVGSTTANPSGVWSFTGFSLGTGQFITAQQSNTNRSSNYNNYATLPFTQASNITFPNTTTNSIELTWTSGSGLKSLVVARANTPVNTPVSPFSFPLNGVVYPHNSIFGTTTALPFQPDEFIVYNGGGTNVTVTNLLPNTAYHFTIFAYSDLDFFSNPALTHYKTDGLPAFDNPKSETTICPAITLTPSALPNANEAVFYTQTITASGGTAPYTYNVSSGSLPSGLTLDSATGEISGTPDSGGTFNFDITAADSYGCQGTQSYTIVVIPIPVPVVSLSDIVVSNTIYRSNNQLIYAIQTGVSVVSTTLNSFSFTTSGTYNSGDVNNFKLYYNTTNDFATATFLQAVSPSAGNGETITFSSIGQFLSIGTHYFFIASDINASANIGHTINIPFMFGAGNFNFSPSASITSSLGNSGGAKVISMPIFYTIGNATWNANTNWSIDGTNPCNCSPASLPSATVHIRNTHEVTVTDANDIGINNTIDLINNGILTLQNGNTNPIIFSNNTPNTTIELLAGTLNLANSTTINGTLQNKGGNIALALGTLSFANGSTYEHAMNGGIIPTATWGLTSNCLVTGMTSSTPVGLNQTFGNLTWNCLSQSAGFNAFTLIIKGNLVLQNSNGRATGLNNITLEGNFTNNIGLAFSPLAGSFTFAGTSTQTATGATTFEKLTINNPNNVILAASTPITVTNTLTLTNGRIQLGNNNLAYQGTEANLTRTNGWIVTNGTGKFVRTGSGTGTFNFPVGNATNFKNIQLSTYNNTGVRYIDAPSAPAIPLALQTNGLNATWEITGTTLPSATLRIDNPGGATNATSLIRRWNGSVWIPILTTFTSPNYQTTAPISIGTTENFAVLLGCPTITLSPTTLALPQQDVPYSQTLTASGGTAPYSYAVTAGVLPTGLTLSGAGVLSGTPTTVGTFNFTITATDANTCTGIQAYTLVVVPAQPLSNRGMYFDGVNDYIESPSSTVLSGGSDFTISGWVKPQASSNMTVISRWKIGDASSRFTVVYVGSEERLYISDVNGSLIKTPIGSIPLKKWTHFAVVYTHATRQIEWYVNGVSSTSGILTTGINTGGTQTLKIGAVFNPTNQPTIVWEGQLDEIRAFDATRTLAQIQTDAASQTPNGAVAYWNFDDDAAAGNQTIAINLGTTGASSNGTLINSPLWALRTTNTLDDGSVGSLRWAINEANTDTDTDYIDFSVYNNTPTTAVINLSNALPDIIEPILIDGYSALGSSVNTLTPLTSGTNATLRVQIQSGGSVTAPIKLLGNSANSVLRGIALRNFTGAYVSLGRDNISLLGSFIGYDADGNVDAQTEAEVVFSASSANIGTTAAANRNLLRNIYFDAGGTHTDNKIINNLIGTNKTTARVATGNIYAVLGGGSLTGLEIKNNIFNGGTATVPAISRAIHLQRNGGTINNTLIQGNLIGKNGVNQSFYTDGILLQNTTITNTIIGGALATEANIITNTVTPINTNGNQAVIRRNSISCNDNNIANVTKATPSIVSAVIAGANLNIQINNVATGDEIDIYQNPTACTPILGEIYNTTFVATTGNGTYTIPVGTLAIGNIITIQARSTTNSSPYSASVELSLAAPVAVAATSITDVSFVANWNAVTGATEYRLDVATDLAFTNIVAGYNNLSVSATNQSVTGLKPNTTYYYRVRAFDGANTSPNSNIISLNTCITTVINIQPSPATVCVGDATSFSVVASGTGLTYQWQLSIDGGTNYNNLTNSGVYSGVTTPILIISSTTLGMNSYLYRVVVNACSPATITSNAALLNINTPPAIVNHPTSTTVCEGSNVNFVVAASGAGLSYQWQISTDGGGTFDNILSATTTTLNLSSVTTAMNGYQYRVLIAGTCSPSIISNVATLTIPSATITTQPVNSSLCVNGTTAFNISATPSIGATLTYQWQESTDGGGTFNNLINAGIYSGVTTTTLTLSGVTNALNTYQYRCIITSTANSVSCSINSTSAVLTVVPLAVISVQPASTTACVNNNVTFNVSATGSGVLSYQWQLSTDGGGTFNDISGETLASLSVLSVTHAMSGYQYRCIVTNTVSPNSCAIISDAAVLTVPSYTFSPLSGSLPNATANLAYSQTITATGGSGSFNYALTTGTLPTGITFNTTTGVISGIPTQTGTFNFTITSTDQASPNCQATANYTIQVLCPTITLSPGTLSNGTAGVSYSSTISSANGVGTITYSLVSGSFPSGISLSSSTGVLSGVPTVVGTFNFTLRATDSNGCFGELAYALTINCQVLTLAPATLSLTLPFNEPYTQTFTQSNGIGSVSYTLNSGTLPTGLTLNNSTGVLSGTPTNLGTFNFTIRATDQNGCFVENNYTLIVTQQASNIVFSSITTNQMTLNWTNGNGANRIVVARAGSSITANPLNTNTYTSNSIFGSGADLGGGNFVVFNGTGSSVIVTGLNPATQYTFKVFEYNGSGITTSYLLADATNNPAQRFTLDVEPTIQATNIVFSGSTINSTNINWTQGNGTAKLVLAKIGSPIDANPIDGTTYTANNVFGSGSQIGTGNYVVYQGNGIGLPQLISNLVAPPNTPIYFKVFEFNGTGQATNYNISNAVGNPNSVILLAPEPTLQATNILFTNVTTTQMQLSWTNGNGAKRMLVGRANVPVSFTPIDGTTYVANASFGSGTDVGSGEFVLSLGVANSVLVTNLNPNTLYHFRVFEYNDDNTAGLENYLLAPALGNPRNRSTLDVEPNLQATNIVITSRTINSIGLSWSNGNGANRIVVARLGNSITANPTDSLTYVADTTFGVGADLGGGNFVIFNGAGNNVTLTGLSPATQYTFKVFEYNGSGLTTNYLLSDATNNPLSAFTLATEPTQVTNITLNNITDTSTDVSWTNGNGANRLIVVSTTPITNFPADGFAYTSNNTFGLGQDLGSGNFVAYIGNANNFTLTGLNPVTIYYLRAFEFNGNAITANYNINTAVGNPTNFTTADPLIVVNASDANTYGSLRYAINYANTKVGADVITFQIAPTGAGGGLKTINITNALPNITESLTIDGFTQGNVGYSGEPLIELNGATAGVGVNGLVSNANNVIINGLAINRFNGSGILIDNASNNIITNNRIGTNPAGTTALANSIGISVRGVSSNNNNIGLVGQGNLVSGNTNAGIVVALQAQNTRIRANRIGTNWVGNAPLPNQDGIVVATITNTQFVGGNLAGEGNLIAGNTQNGIVIRSNNNTIQANLIGTQANGSTALANGQNGILLENNANSNTITNNTIAYNSNGVNISNVGTNNQNNISQNSIFCNTSKAIELNGAGNLNKVAPIIAVAITTQITGNCQIGDIVELYSSDNTNCTSVTSPQGRTYLGNATVVGNTWVFNGTFSLGTAITALARDANNNTSEFTTPAYVVTINNITINTITPSTYCANTNITIPFSSTGVFTSNTFTAQLSDVNGNFANPLVIGTRTADAIGTNIANTINAVLPANLISSTNYRIRIIATDGTISTLSNTLTINELPVIINQPANVASYVNETKTFSISANTPSALPITYQWQVSIDNGLNFNDLIGQTNSTLTLLLTQTMNNYQYRCVVQTNASCQTISNPATLSVKPALFAIPDANFRAWLVANYSACMIVSTIDNLPRLDITCTAVINATNANVSGLNISNLSGIEYFTNLQNLNASNNNLNNLPTLANTLQTLNIAQNQFTNLPALPNTLQTLTANNNNLVALVGLPNSLINLQVANNTNLSNLPNLSTQTPNLQTLNAENTGLNSLPTLPNTMIVGGLSVANNALDFFDLEPVATRFNNIAQYSPQARYTGLPANVNNIVRGDSWTIESPTVGSNAITLYQWFRGTTPLNANPSIADKTLNIPIVDFPNEGIYTCQAISTNPNLAGLVLTSTEVDFRIIPENVPNTPTNLSVVRDAQNRAVLNWQWQNNVLFTRWFVIERAEGGSTDFVEIANSLANLNFVDNNLQPNVTYFYRIRAANIAGNSGYTDAIGIVIAPTTTTAIEPALQTAVRLYPNPTPYDYVQMEIGQGLQGNLEVKLVNMQGVVLKTTTFVLDGNMQILTIKLNDLPTGTYNLLINKGKQQIIRQVVKVN